MGYLITFLVGAGLLILSVSKFSKAINLIQSGHRVMAVVDRLEKEKSKKGYTYRPIFKYQTMSGQEVWHSYMFAASPPDWEVGEKATIVYQASDPENPVILTYFGAFGWAVIWLAVAVPLLIVGGGYFLAQFYLKSYSL
ncbi:MULTISPECIES: DUF3592 domain-containing protein [unclassified Spirosoma]|uniref:DUF3592 domain-containing protein n=1 Tax=unclassified Spirosoma TaxID=2621999 RepID=UPI00095C269B|nr:MULTISPECIES: DUF3592 domain-containing protein [unclassified Spirosoma]MBN8825518.1 DUF3592 domain-containing protein [Spirosoma sp.]OJW74229.1 MAG: hypothetical protein BGO59_14025 [Spirosoma sp. 48-14]